LKRRLLSLPGDSAVLDIGAGAGHLGTAVREHFSHLTGVESDPEAASSPGASVYDRWITAPLSGDLDFGRQFDVVVCADVLEHLSSPDGALLGIRKWLKPGATLLVSLPNVANITVRAALLAGKFPYSDRGLLDRTHLRFYTRRSARNLLRECGYRVERTTPTAMPAELKWEILGRSPFRPVVRAFALGAARLWPTLFVYQFVLEARQR